MYLSDMNRRSNHAICHRWTLAILLALLTLSVASATSGDNQRYLTTQSLILSKRHWGVVSSRSQLYAMHLRLRGGESTEQGDEYDDEESEAQESESDDGDESENEENDDETAGVQIEMNIEKFEEPLVPSPMISLGASLGVMLLAKRVDLFHPTVVRIARFMFIAYLISLQAFVLYARLKAKSYNDRTPITMSSPLSGVLNAQLGDQGGMMKNLASSLLSSESTVMEYDLKQARSMQSGLLFNMLFMWFLHFKMNQVQPLIIQTITGLANLFYSPLFQVYVLGRNLERPFKNPAIPKMELPATEDVSGIASPPDTLPAEASTPEHETTDDSDDEQDRNVTPNTASHDLSHKARSTVDIPSDADSSDTSDESEDEE